MSDKLPTDRLRELQAVITPGPWWSAAQYSGAEMGCAIVAARTDCGPLPGNPTRGLVAFASAVLNTDARRCEANARLIAAAPDLLAELLQLRAKLIEEREARLWEAYGVGHERRGEWDHGHMADAIWLLRECGIDPTLRWHNAAMIREAIPEAAKRVLTEDKGDV